MAEHSYLLQPLHGAMGDHLIDVMTHSDFNRCTMVVAWAKHSALLRMKEAMNSFRARGGLITVYVGIDMQGTSYEALHDLLELTDELYVVHSSDRAQTYHPKLYLLSNDFHAEATVGSNNLTVGGLWRNIELSTITHYNLSNNNDRLLLESLGENLRGLFSQHALVPKAINETEEIELLKAARLVDYEVKMKLRQSKSTRRTNEARMEDYEALGWFVSNVPTRVPSTESAKQHGVVDTRTKDFISNASTATLKTSVKKGGNATYDVLWLESRNMTGGSANQLDLSMTAKIEYGNAAGTPFDIGEANRMSGAVTFFGIDPKKVETPKMIDISYDGHDFKGNKVYMPNGSKRDNGTWRLQLNGVDCEDGTPFTKFIPEHYLRQKILAFEYVSDNRFALSVFPGSDLDEFISSSSIVARNGSGYGNAKYLGLL